MQSEELSVGKQGRVVIPASLRKQLAIKPGSRLRAWVEDGRLVMEASDRLWDLIDDACSKVPADVDLAQALIDERREAAMEEDK